MERRQLSAQSRAAAPQSLQETAQHTAREIALFWAPTDKALVTSAATTTAPTVVNKMMRFKPPP